MDMCGSCGACLDCMLPAGVQVTTALGFFLCSGRLSDSEDSDSLLLRGCGIASVPEIPQPCGEYSHIRSYTAIAV